MAMLSLEKAAAKIIDELELKPYSVTPSLLCEWGRTSEGKIISVQLPFSGEVTTSNGEKLVFPLVRYFELLPESLFELEMKDNVQITTLLHDGEALLIDPPATVKIAQLRIDNRNVNKLIQTCKELERRPLVVSHDNFSVADEIFAEIADSTIHGTRMVTMQMPESEPAMPHVQVVRLVASLSPTQPEDALSPAMEIEQSKIWPLFEPKEGDTLNKVIYTVLKEKHDLSEPLPPVKDVMSLCKMKNKYGILLIADELKYLDGKGRLQSANVENVSKRIYGMTNKNTHYNLTYSHVGNQQEA